jgi:hypothetical protein
VHLICHEATIMRHLRTPPLSLLFLLALSVGAASGCAGDPDDADMFGGGGGGGDDTSEPPAEETCTFTYQNAIVDGGLEITIFYIYLFPSGADDLGSDLLGSRVLPYGYELDVTDVPQGTYDTVVVDEDDYFYVASGVECDGSDWSWLITVGDVAGQLD